ncbi:MAG: hypothetical protein M9942_06270 [Microthrixaceae bacterium]|nr:hypothetical protein [Microthrixaceae bacterium]MCO5318028.1 hypothetical protein [Microthrixaceae bacterium]
MDSPITHDPCGSPASRSFGCSECTLVGSEHCDDCLVTYLCDDSDCCEVVVSLDEVRLVRRLQAGGLVPPLRHRPAAGASG